MMNQSVTPNNLADLLTGQDLPMQQATGNWVQDEDDNQWLIKNKNGDVLGKMPRTWDEHDVMVAIHLARKYELDAYKIGVALGRDAAVAAGQTLIRHKNEHIQQLESMNLALSSKLEKFIIGEDEDGD